MNPTTSASPTLSIARTFDAPRERVFAAFTDAAIVRQWFAPDGTVDEAHWDARAGGTFRIAMTVANGEVYIVSGTFSAVRPPEHLAFSFRWAEDDPALERDTFVSIDFIGRGTRTEMTFVQTHFRDDESRDNHRSGWTASLDNLAALLAK
jgi:uncharacterized protein YndB with AHSA1/START domain